MRERPLCTILKLYTNSFCRQRLELEVVIKVTSIKQIDGSKAEKVLQKIDFLFLSKIKNVKVLSMLFFLPITAQLFSIAALFPMLSILTILDKCQTKAFRDFNQKKTFLFKNFFFFLEKAFI